MEDGRKRDIHRTEQRQNSAVISPIPDRTMLGTECSDRNFNQKFDASNLNAIIVKSLQEKKKRVLNCKIKYRLRVHKQENIHNGFPSQTCLSTPSSLLQRIGERRLNVPDCNVGTLGEDCLCQTF